MKLRKKWRITILTVVSLFVLWLIYYTSISVVYGIKIRRLKAQVAVEGSSLDQASLAATYDPPPSYGEPNGALYFKAAALLLQAGAEGSGPRQETEIAFSGARPGERAKIVSEKRQEIRDIVKRRAKAIELLHEGAKCQQAWFAVDYSKGYEMLLPHLPALRDGARTLQFAAWDAAADGDSHKALQAVWTGLRLRRSIEKEPIPIGYLVGCATDRLTLKPLPEMLTIIQPSADDLRPILTEVEALDRQAFRRAMEGERAQAAMVFEWARRDGLCPTLKRLGIDDHLRGSLPILAVRVFRRIANVLPMDESFYLSNMNSMVASARDMETPSLANTRRLELGDHAVSEGFSFRVPYSFRNAWWRSLTHALLPALFPSFGENQKDNALHDVSQCGIAAELYRLDQGAYPASLNALAPKYLASLPLDTFSGKALLFKSLPNGVLIYSVGLNGTDDGGLSDEQQGTDDIAWRVERTGTATDNP